jgi:hypothetical protein
MTMPYRHTQIGTVILVVCAAGAALGAFIGWRASAGSMTVMFIILATVAVIFNSLTVEIEDRELRWYFGPGFWTYRLALEEIDSIAVVRNRWWNGFGIRATPRFTLYNVSGLDAVELKLNSGNVKRIGTDDPEGLAAALQSAALSR